MNNNGWMPIESAPKDGESFIAGSVGKTDTYMAFWGYWFDRISGESKNGPTEHGSLNELPHVTHWMPAPAPPTGEDA